MSVINELGADARPSASARWRTDWLRGPRHDLALALLWVPFATAALAVGDDPDRLRWLVAGTLLFSFAHQPLTLWLVYADAAQRRAHSSLIVWAPIVLVVAIAVGTSVRPEVVALAAGLWNVAHTLRQRFGLCKLYGRLGGIDCGADNRLLWSWLVSAASIAFARTDLGATARSVGLGRRNTRAIEIVASVQDAVVLLLPLVLVGTIVITARWARNELERPSHSASRLLYLASTAALLAVLAIDPVVGFVAYVGAHAAEYFLVVRWRVDRAAQKSIAGDGVGWLARRVGGSGTLALYAVAVVTLLGAIRFVEPGAVVPVIVLTLGGLHLLYDGVIWKSPRPAVVDPR
jgi:hypothetical protein